MYCHLPATARQGVLDQRPDAAGWIAHRLHMYGGPCGGVTMPFEFTFTVDSSRLLLNYRARIARGFQMAGVAWQSEARHYPSKMQGPWPDVLYTRTGNLAKSANFQVVEEGRVMHLLAPFYYRYLLFGTGLFGPRRDYIYPVSAPRLAIPKSGGGYLFVSRVRGSIWEGKAQQVREKVVEGFKTGVKGPL